MSLIVEPGEFLRSSGLPGCGKTTTLRMVAGLEEPTAGRVFIGDEDVTAGRPRPRHHHGLPGLRALPHLPVFDNVAYGLRVLPSARGDESGARSWKRWPRRHGGLGRAAGALSGGQQQRVALARALVLRAQVLLFDEPLSNLDAKLRTDARRDPRLQQRAGITALYVTHDQTEALAVSDRIAVMDHGRVEQIGAPPELYPRPATRFVADFIGEANLLAGRLSRVGGHGARGCVSVA